MSLDAYHHSLLSTSINFKKFVRESDSNPEGDESSEKRELNFRGNEARIAYEEIINDRVGDEKKKNNRDKRRRSSHSEREKLETRDRDKPREPRKHTTRITANCVLKAVESGDLNFLERNITSVNVNISDDYGWTPLMSAAFCGNYKIVDFLLKLGANTRCRDKSGFTAGGLASKKNYSGIVALLKEKQSSSNPEASSSTVSSPRKDSDRRRKRKEFYCTICRESFKETTLKKHQTSTLHIFNTKPKLPENGYYSIPKHNKGYQMLLKKGWNEGGLGPDARGSKYPVKTVLKRDRRGFDEGARTEARVTHFGSSDTRAVASATRQPRERTLKKRDRERLLSKEARRERAFRRALS
ncbi:G patch domain and ankyrin repeat-containing protein 1 homolog [Venturia canescens]|uniref:G patch domain and ankyrin repeat-containing protein 1 homolog n=1 Tax=Venturia canescens TaxID=32260 RepID=UPI001C9C2A8E|nr:G patch domain and ankyrin repeat-containing protein 1 homolog [Venturia canescens]